MRRPTSRTGGRSGWLVTFLRYYIINYNNNFWFLDLFSFSRAYFKQDLQLYKTRQSANQSNVQQLHILHCTFDFTTAQIVINCTLKYALSFSVVLVTFKSNWLLLLVTLS